MQLTWIGHATVLLELDGTRVLTDPVLRNRVAHLRATRPAPSRGELGRIDAVLLSHAHWDHLDVRSLRRLGETHLIAPAAAARSLRLRGFRGEVDTVEAGEERTLGGIIVTATTARHGAPGSAIGFLLRGSSTAYFAGDTDLFPEMDGLADPLEVALAARSGAGARRSARVISTRRAPPRRCGCSSRGSPSRSTGAPSIRSACPAGRSSAIPRTRSAARRRAGPRRRGPGAGAGRDGRLRCESLISDRRLRDTHSQQSRTPDPAIDAR